MGAVIAEECMLQTCGAVPNDSFRKCLGNVEWELSLPESECYKHVGKCAIWQLWSPMSQLASLSTASMSHCCCVARLNEKRLLAGSCRKQSEQLYGFGSVDDAQQQSDEGFYDKCRKRPN
jgi:hypothetical protein